MKFKSKNIIELKPENFNIKLKKIVHPSLDGTKKAMVAYVAPWCGYCVKFKPIYEDVGELLGGSFPLFYMDCDKYSEFSRRKLNINGFPTVLYINTEGKPYKKYTNERSWKVMINDICKEAKVCSSKNLSSIK